ncbi:DNA helicase [Tanacetum coccineum]
MTNIPNYHLNDDSLQGNILYEIEIILNDYGNSLQHFGLGPPPSGLLDMLANRLLMEERNYNEKDPQQQKAKPDVSSDERDLICSFASWLLDIKDGKIGEPDQQVPGNTSWIDIPLTHCLLDYEQDLSKLMDFIYDKNTLRTPCAMVQGKTKTYLSHDEVTPLKRDGAETEMLYPIEHLNTLMFPDFPPHQLELKVGAPVILLRNVNALE